MSKIIINKTEVSLDGKKTILEVADSIGIKIPTLCYLKGYDHFTSCMLCVVLDKKNNNLIPSCSIFAEDGMEIETENSRIESARKDTIDMLLSEHVGDCEATCTRGCPANMEIPLMIRHIKNQNYKAAIKTIKKDIVLPAVLGRICSAPCENSCIRKLYDNSVSICELKRKAADIDLESDNPYQPEISAETNKKIAVIGSGPTGLAAAYYLRQYGHSVIIYDKNEHPGGMLRYGVADDKFDKTVLEKEVNLILNLGAEFKGGYELGVNLEFTNLINNNDAVVLATGALQETSFVPAGLDKSEKGINVNKKTFQTNIPKVFAGGNVVKDGRSAIRSCAHGKLIAESVNNYLNRNSASVSENRFNSSVGKLRSYELDEVLKEASDYNRITPADSGNTGFSNEEAVKESGRCFHCDCRKKDNCKLRDYADEFNGDQKRYKIETRNSVKKIKQHTNVIYEPGKCIKCNLCVRITEKAGEALGLAMVNRGFEITVTVPFNETLDAGLSKTAREVVNACPTAALSFIEEGEGKYE